MTKVVTRFAPSPTGYLHIGGARTALFNWLFSRHHGGTFLLRIEDTDRERSTDDAVQKIFQGLKWLGLDWDGEPVMQFSRMNRHAEVAHKMLAEGKAYHCYCSQEELEEMRNKAKAEGRPMRYDGRWRDRDPKDAPAGVKPVVRFKAPQAGSTVIKDHVQGDVTFQNEQLDDLIILRSDGTPTYNLSVVVDDHDMGVTHIIRGDDHLTNAARQTQLYLAAGFVVPDFAHIPLIHGPDGAKLSKRHGALGTEAYADMGYLPAAMRNYLLRLGWSHGDEEIISTQQAIEWFGLDHVGRSPARFDFAKLNNLNGHYIRHSSDDDLLAAALPFVEKKLGRACNQAEVAQIKAILPTVKERAKDLNEITEALGFLFVARPIQADAAAQKHLDDAAKARIRTMIETLNGVSDWTAASTEAAVRALSETQQVKLGQLAQPLRAALTGRTVSPPIFDVLAVLGREETLARLADAAR
ncbi:glutamate--tRNA ligase [Ferrovibrio terrae]|uniref:Glutamate--tRNA ligase n=1 Tax=Ferrovibrio terrae TaxID=2594003 RepID=A0A516H3X2_9PROT|nr:glutamate--tRNA ligase [Ferrovibrio terrae]QDO98467.1 glutamate--tRNA ligase [Ferrovibrio terrae]